EPSQNGGRYRGNERSLIDFLAPVDVRDMELDDRSWEHLQRVEQRNRPERQAGRIDDDAGADIDRLMDPVDELMLCIGLMEPQRPVAGRFSAHCLDLVERRGPVDFRLTLAQAIEVWPVEDKNRLCGHLRSFPRSSGISE